MLLSDGSLKTWVLPRSASGELLLHAKEDSTLQARLQAPNLAPITSLHAALDAPALACATHEGGVQVWDAQSLASLDVYFALHEVTSSSH